MTTRAQGAPDSTSHAEDRPYRAVFEAAPDGILIVDAQGAIRDINPAALRMFGYDRSELVGQPVEVLVPEPLRDVHAAHRAAYMEEPRSRPMGIGMELAGRHRGGERFPVEISLSPLREGGETLVIAVVRDVTLRKRLRAFGAGEMRAAEEERQRIARELHDDMAQRLSSLLVLLRLATRAEDEEVRAGRLAEMRSQLQEVAEEVRRIARGLRPPALADAGVVPAVRSLVRNLRTSRRVQAELEAEAVDHLLSPDEKLVLYRVVQEALSNVVRHADAAEVQVRIAPADGAVVADVIDDGRGFDPEWESRNRGLGLIGMRERAATVGGSLRVESAPGRGTRVRLEIPVSQENDPDG